MEVIILAGGFGTRLRHIIEDVPKPMAPIQGYPFLTYLFEYLSLYDITKIILATGYKSASIECYYNAAYKKMALVYSVEYEPLGTGGAIQLAMKNCATENIVIMNGDTFFNVDLKAMQQNHHQTQCDVTIAVKQMSDFDRYGTVECKKGKITRFNEKEKTKAGLINGGIYIVKKQSLASINETTFSFEKDFLEKNITTLKFTCFESKGYFIDIGIPEDYYKACSSPNFIIRR